MLQVLESAISNSLMTVVNDDSDREEEGHSIRYRALQRGRRTIPTISSGLTRRPAFFQG
jgi:hypothetical protein